MTRDAVSAGLYEADASDYTKALKQARQRKQRS